MYFNFLDRYKSLINGKPDSFYWRQENKIAPTAKKKGKAPAPGASRKAAGAYFITCLYYNISVAETKDKDPQNRRFFTRLS